MTKQYRKYFLIIAVISVVAVFAFNFLAFWMKVEKYIVNRKARKNDLACSINQQISFKKILLPVTVIASMIIGLAYVVGNLSASQNREFKCISSIYSSDVAEKDKIKYAIVYETTDKYIVCPLKKQENGQYKLDTSKNMVISNLNVQTETIDEKDIVR